MSHVRVMSHLWSRHVTHAGWLRSVGSLRSQVSFAKKPCTRDCILQKRPMIVKSLLIVATPYPLYHTYMNHVTHMNESCHTHEWVMSHVWSRHVTHIRYITHMPNRFRQVWCHTYACIWVMSQTGMSLVTYVSHIFHMNVSYHTYESYHMYESYHTCESCYKYGWVVSHICMSHIGMSHVAGVSRHVWHDSFICVTWLMHSFIYVTHIWMSHVTHVMSQV